MKKKKIGFSIMLFASLTIASLYSFKLDIETVFTEEEMVDINKEIEDRVAAFIANEKKICQQELMEMVDVKVDTILMFDIKELLKGDSDIEDNTPPRPEPPEKPEILKPQDDTPLQPLIEDERELFD